MSLGLSEFRQQLISVCNSCGRNPAEVTLVAVSKKQSLSKIHEAYREKQLDFGENYIQEALEKQQALQMQDIRWHLIGPIQKNKINKILGKFHLIHSVDSLETAMQIDNRAARENIKTSVLLQLNLAGEDTKSGQTKEELLKNWDAYKNLNFVEIKGLMTMPPLENDPEMNRSYFKELKALNQQLQLKELSMGTSADWKVAVEEGATLIRIGTAVFGERGS